MQLMCILWMPVWMVNPDVASRIQSEDTALCTKTLEEHQVSRPWRLVLA